MINKIICQQCKHYYITWESAKPHGCRAYGFKSQQVCSVVVKQSSNMDCNLFSKKQNNSNSNNNSKDTQMRI